MSWTPAISTLFLRPPPKGILGQLLNYHLPKGWPKYSLGGSLSESLQISLNRAKPGTHAGQCAAGVLSVRVPCMHPTPKSVPRTAFILCFFLLPSWKVVLGDSYSGEVLEGGVVQECEEGG